MKKKLAILILVTLYLIMFWGVPLVEDATLYTIFITHVIAIGVAVCGTAGIWAFITLAEQL